MFVLVKILLGDYALRARYLRVPIMKFPRTAHVMDAGGTSVSRDDLLLTNQDIAVSHLLSPDSL
jgi:hypothetical protein